MLEKTFSKPAFVSALRKLRDSYQIFVPVKEGDFHLFKPLDDTEDPDFAYQNTRLSPKGLVYPQSERMFEVNLDEKDLEGTSTRSRSRTIPLARRWGSGPVMLMGFRL